MLPLAEDVLLLRYETQRVLREFHRALGDLTRMAQSGSDLVAVEEVDNDVPAESTAEKPPSTPSTPETSEELASVGNPPSSPTEPRPPTPPATAAEPSTRAHRAKPGQKLALRRGVRFPSLYRKRADPEGSAPAGARRPVRRARAVSCSSCEAMLFPLPPCGGGAGWGVGGRGYPGGPPP